VVAVACQPRTRKSFWELVRLSTTRTPLPSFEHIFPQAGSTVSPSGSPPVTAPKRLACFVNHPHRFPFHFVRYGLEASRPREERQECGGVDHPTLRLSHSLVHRDPAGRCYVDSHVDTQDLGGPPRVARLQDLQALGKSTHFSLCVFWWSWMCSTPSLFRFVASSRSRVAFSTSFVISTVYGHVHTLLHRARRVIRSAFIPEHPAIRSPTITVSAAPDGPRRGGTAGDHRRPHADRCSPGITLGIPHQP
jgi:hypothetical protein